MGSLRGQDVIYAMFILILTFLLVNNWKGSNALLQSAGAMTIGLTKTLQGR